MSEQNQLSERPAIPVTVSAGGSQSILFLTNNRISQQKIDYDSIKKTKEKNKNKIVKIKKRQPFFCQQVPVLKIYLRNDHIEQVVKSRLRCKSWSCPECALINAICAYYKIGDVAVNNSLHYFLTLTLDPQNIPDQYFQDGLNRTHKYITYLFNRFANKLRKLFKEDTEKIRYVWVTEFQRNGNAHLHILLNKRVDIDFVRSEWVKIGGGKIMRVEEVENIERIASYVSKYISKSLEEIATGTIGFFPNEKRYSISQSCIKKGVTIVNLAKNKDLLDLYKDLVNKEITKT